MGCPNTQKNRGINPKFDLPKNKKQISEKHKDKNIQTILDPELLNKKMGGTRRLARHVKENEKGVDTLFLAIGFVRWYESSRSDVPIDVSSSIASGGTK